MSETTADIDELHRLELEARPSKSAKVRYAARTLGPEASSRQVSNWLLSFGIEPPGKSTLHQNIAQERGTPVAGNGPDTTDLPKLDAGRMAALEAELSAAEESAASRPAESLTADSKPESAEATGPESEPESGAALADHLGRELEAMQAQSRTPRTPVRGPGAEGPEAGESGRAEASESGPVAEIGPGSGSGLPEPSPEESGSGSGLAVRSPDGPGPEVRTPVRTGAGPESGPIDGPESGSGRSGVAESESESSPEGPESEPEEAGRIVVWPVLLMALSAFVAVWSGWVGLGEMTGFGEVKPLPGIAPNFQLNSAITLPIGVEAYAAYAMYVWLGGRARTAKTINFAKYSSIGALLLGAAGQVAYHLLEQANSAKKTEAQQLADAAAAANGQKAAEVVIHAPWWITTFVSFLPVVVLGLGAALVHMVLSERDLRKKKRAAEK